jgi:DNA polymerase V
MLDEAAIDAELARLPLTDIWGIAGRLARRRAEIGITTPLALKQTDPRFVRERFSVTLERTARELQGIPCISFEDAPPNRKTVMASRSFGKLVTARQEMEEAVASYAARAAEKMRRQNLAACRLMVFVQTNPFRPQDPQYAREQGVQLPVATADTGMITSAAKRGLGAIWRDGFHYKKAGVMLLDLVPDPISAAASRHQCAYPRLPRRRRTWH